MVAALILFLLFSVVAPMFVSMSSGIVISHKKNRR